MTAYERALKNLENIETLSADQLLIVKRILIKELTETVLGEAVIERYAEIAGNKDLAPRVKNTILKDPKGELCAEFVDVVRKAVKAGN